MQTATMLPLQPRYRIQSIDLLRGLVMIIMALDHVRDYFHWSAQLYDPLDFSHTSTPIFVTRWITHFCAPVFMFLAGTSAYLVGQRKTKKQLSFFLFTRGLWLRFAGNTSAAVFVVPAKESGGHPVVSIHLSEGRLLSPQ